MADHTKQDEGERRVAIVSGSTGKPISNSRRRFLSNAGMFSAGLVGSTLLAACSDGDSNIAVAQDNQGDGDGLFNPAISDAAVLQFALNLEYLEAEYYLLAVTGSNLSADDTGGGQEAPGTVTGGNMVPWGGDTLVQRYAGEIALDELDHVQFLRAGLGDARIARPQINFTAAFNGAATAALQNAGLIGADSTASFDPFASPLGFLLGAFIFEDVGVTAYKGGAQFIRNRDFLTAAAGILSVEGYHAGLVRTVLTSRGDDEVTFQTSEGPMTVDVYTAVQAISDARDLVDGLQNEDGDSDNGAPGLDQGIGDADTTVSIYMQDYPASNIVPTDGNGITFSRTPPQIHNIAYLSPNAVSMGGFFPQGTRIPAAPSLTTAGGSAPPMDDDNGEDGETM
ncbi:ferritin-like domain-containing protein [Salinisphaera sp.]|uniref:ferritin-like domain-containing protein n=1 Tax=Salinisphaera sp. TaxID=1914330 RepID=UPI000C387D1A|nr:ferritin-like domain-containing protein [Salinisphaera sp.]MAS10832.1 hypothetical protein [Salinisphaera sp.]|tara:strand:+ start:1476 stop:2663 length:1188 start_codon:yes stop_codon:yes gene_type:complete